MIISELPKGMGNRVRVNCSARDNPKNIVLIGEEGTCGGFGVKRKIFSIPCCASFIGQVQWKK